MGIKGSVRRRSDGHIIHANIDTDIIVTEEPPFGSTRKPDELCVGAGGGLWDAVWAGQAGRAAGVAGCFGCGADRSTLLLGYGRLGARAFVWRRGGRGGLADAVLPRLPLVLQVRHHRALCAGCAGLAPNHGWPCGQTACWGVPGS